MNRPPEPDTSYSAPYAGHRLKYHSEDQIIEYGNKRAVAAVAQAFQRSLSNQQPDAPPLEVVVERGRVWLRRAHRSFMLAHDESDPMAREWYANQLREVLGLDMSPTAHELPLDPAGQPKLTMTLLERKALDTLNRIKARVDGGLPVDAEDRANIDFVLGFATLRRAGVA